MTAPALYRGATAAAAPLIRLLLARRLRAGKEDPARCAERFGQATRARPPGPLVWVHAASVGESLSVLALIERLAAKRSDMALLITTGTVTSARLMEQRLPPRAVHQYVPVDRLSWVRRFLDHWRPGLALWVESEFWPNLLGELADRHIPLVLVNARVSARSYAGWRRLPGTIRQLLDHFDVCLAQSEADRDKLLALGARRVRLPGNLKFAAAPLPADETALATLRASLGTRRRWLAASTHPGEEAIIAEAHRRLRSRFPDLLTLIVPRHPARGPEIARALAESGLTVTLRSRGEAPDGAEIHVADTVGELGLFYRLAPIAFMGGSLVAHGGQNLLEPAKLGCAVLHGPDMANFAAIVEEMLAEDATEIAGDAESIAAAVGRMLADDGLRARRAAAAAAIARRKDDILDAVMDELAPYLDALSSGTADAAQRHACA
jgi:3-deoxy-D-manno-octulosonic-acid transferase